MLFMLPDVDGWRIVQSLREAGCQTPVLFLTARDSVNDRVKGLELGADDYLVKPFAFAERTHLPLWGATRGVFSCRRAYNDRIVATATLRKGLHHAHGKDSRRGCGTGL